MPSPSPWFWSSVDLTGNQTQYELSIGRSNEDAWIDDSLLSNPLTLNPQLVDSYIEYSQKCVDYLRFGYEVDACLSEVLPIYSDVMISKQTPVIFLECGFANLPILHTQSHLRNELKPKDDYRHFHGLSIEQIKSLPELLEDPIMIFDAPSPRNQNNEIIRPGKGVVAIVDCLDSDNIPLTAYFSPNGHGQYEAENITSNFLTSIYGRNNLTQFINRAAEENKILFVNPTKYEYMKKDSLRFDEPQCSPAIENLHNIIRKSSQIINTAPSYSLFWSSVDLTGNQTEGRPCPYHRG